MKGSGQIHSLSCQMDIKGCFPKASVARGFLHIFIHRTDVRHASSCADTPSVHLYGVLWHGASFPLYIFHFMHITLLKISSRLTPTKYHRLRESYQRSLSSRSRACIELHEDKLYGVVDLGSDLQIADTVQPSRLLTSVSEEPAISIFRID